MPFMIDASHARVLAHRARDTEAVREAKLATLEAIDKAVRERAEDGYTYAICECPAATLDSPEFNEYVDRVSKHLSELGFDVDWRGRGRGRGYKLIVSWEEETGITTEEGEHEET